MACLGQLNTSGRWAIWPQSGSDVLVLLAPLAEVFAPWEPSCEPREVTDSMLIRPRRELFALQLWLFLRAGSRSFRQLATACGSCRFGSPMASLPSWLLVTPAHLLEQSSDLGRIVTDTKELDNHFIDTRPDPDLARKAVLLSALGQFSRQLIELICRQSRWGSGSFTGRQACFALLSVCFQCLADPALCQAKGPGNIGLSPACVFEFDAPPA